MTEIVAPLWPPAGEWTAAYDTAIALPRLEAGRCPSCGRKAKLQPNGWRRCIKAGEPYPVEFQVRHHGVDLVVVFRMFDTRRRPGAPRGVRVR